MSATCKILWEKWTFKISKRAWTYLKNISNEISLIFHRLHPFLIHISPPISAPIIAQSVNHNFPLITHYLTHFFNHFPTHPIHPSHPFFLSNQLTVWGLYRMTKAQYKKEYTDVMDTMTNQNHRKMKNTWCYCFFLFHLFLLFFIILFLLFLLFFFVFYF